MRKNLLLLFVALIISLLIAEVAARLYFAYHTGFIANSSEWAKQKWLKDHADPDMGATDYSMDRFDTLYGWTLKPNLRNHAEQGGWTVSSNTQGVRGTEEHTFDKSTRLRILTIGDSYTFGERVNDEQTYPAILQTLMDSVEVINLGVHGYGHDQQLLKLIAEGLKYHPDIVVLGFLNNDVSRNKLNFRDYAKPCFELNNGQLQLCNVPVPSREYFLKQHELKIWSLIKVKYQQWRDPITENKNYLLTKRIIETMRDTSMAAGAKFVMLYLPGQDECINGQSQYHRVYDSIAAEGNVFCIDPVKPMHNFIKAEKNAASHFTNHYSVPLYHILAEQLATGLDSLRKNSTTGKQLLK